MTSDRSARQRRYLARFTSTDRDLLDAVARHRGMDPGQLFEGQRLDDVLRDPRLFDEVLGTPDPTAPGTGFDPVAASPFLVFATAVHRAWDELDPTGVVEEWTGPRERLPVFAGAQLRAFLDDGDHRLFLAELLTNHVHRSGPAVTVRQGGTVRRRRIDALDVSAMAELLGLVDERTRPAVYRRLGDASLFMTGVFPDHTSRTRFAPVQVDRLARSIQALPGPAGVDLAEALAVRGAVGLLEQLGAHWYRLALDDPAPVDRVAGLASISQQFPQARRALNHLADRWLFPFRQLPQTTLG